MKINEISPSAVKTTLTKKWSDEIEIYDFFLSQGYDITGTGEITGSSILTSPKTSIAIKIFQDKAWLKFAKWTVNKKSSYLPKIRNIKKLNKFYIAYIEKLFELNPVNSKILEEYQFEFVNMIENPSENREKIAYIEQKYKGLFSILKKLYRAKGNFEWDLAKENFMQRSNGNIVIVDPWADW